MDKKPLRDLTDRELMELILAAQLKNTQDIEKIRDFLRSEHPDNTLLDGWTHIDELYENTFDIWDHVDLPPSD